MIHSTRTKQKQQVQSSLSTFYSQIRVNLHRHTVRNKVSINDKYIGGKLYTGMEQGTRSQAMFIIYSEKTFHFRIIYNVVTIFAVFNQMKFVYLSSRLSAISYCIVHEIHSSSSARKRYFSYVTKHDGKHNHKAAPQLFVFFTSAVCSLGLFVYQMPNAPFQAP